MAENIRYNAAQAAARRVLDLLGCPHNEHTGYWLDKIAYHVLEAIYESEGRIAEEREPRRLLCTGCFKALRLVPGCEGRNCRCKACGHKLRLPRSVSLN